MLPCDPSAGFADNALGDPELVGQGLLSHVAASDEDDISVGEFGKHMSFSDARPVPDDRLPDVLDVSTGVKMGRLNTNRPVTGVENERFLGSDGVVCVVDVVRHDVGIHSRPVEVKLSVSRFSGGPTPVPAPKIGRCSGVEPRERLLKRQPPRALRRPSSKRVSMLGPSVPVGSAPSSGLMRLAAVFDRTHSHIGKTTTYYDSLEEAS